MFGLCALLLFALNPAAAAEFAENTAQIRFDPPGQPFVRVFELEVEHKIDADTIATQRTTSVRDLRFFSRNDGWRLVSLPHLTEIVGDLDPLERRVQEMLMDQVLVWQFDAAGQLLETAGFENIEQQATAAFSESELSWVQPIINRETQLWRLRERWERVYAWMLGKVLRPGETHVVERELYPPSGPAMTLKQISHVRSIDAGLMTIDYESELTYTGPLDAPVVIGEKGTRLIDLSIGRMVKEEQVKTITATRMREDGTHVEETRRERSRVNYRFGESLSDVNLP